MSSYEVSVEQNVVEVDVGAAGGGISQASLAKAGIAAIPSGADSVDVDFLTAIDSVSNFALILTMRNTADSFPQDLIVRVSAYTVNGFTAKLNAPTDTANYAVCWALIPCVNG